MRKFFSPNSSGSSVSSPPRRGPPSPPGFQSPPPAYQNYENERLSITEYDDPSHITFVIDNPTDEEVDPVQQQIQPSSEDIGTEMEIQTEETYADDNYAPNPVTEAIKAEPSEQEVMNRSLSPTNKRKSRTKSQIKITVPIKEVAPQIRDQLTRFKRTRPPLTRYPIERHFERSWIGNTAHDIEYFFKYNNERLVRKDIAVGDGEQKKARTWVFFLIFLQISVCIAYAIVLTQVIPRQLAYLIFACIFGGYFGLKLGSVVIFVLRAKLFLPNRCTLPSYTEDDPENDKNWETILVCIPAYNEGEDAFKRTISSITGSHYPKSKLYMFFIVDGNKANSFQSLMTVLNGKPFTERVPPNERALHHGVYQGVGWTVFLKEQNRGKRDSQWLFVEILRCMVFKPSFVLFVDSDTAFAPESILYLAKVLKNDTEEKIAGVCGQIQLSNYNDWEDTVENNIFRLTTIFIVLYQYYEYHFNQILSKQAEAAYGSVTCLPGAFTLFRRKYLEDIEAETDASAPVQHITRAFSAGTLANMRPQSFLYRKNSMNIPLTLSDFFSRKTTGIIERNLYELGEDRTLTVRFLERGLKCLYEPRAIAYTECPDTLKVLLAQRRRWNNSTFINLLMMLLRPKLWMQIRMLPVMLFTVFDFISSYLMPANSVILMLTIWGPAVDVISDALGLNITVGSLVFWWIMIQLIVISTTTLMSAEMFYAISAFFSGSMMGISLYWFVSEAVWNSVTDFLADPVQNWPVIVMISVFPALHLVVSLTKPLSFFTATFYYFMLPTISVTIPFYAFFHLDDFTWGNR